MSDRVAPANGLPQDYQPNGVFFDAYTPAVYRSGAVIVPATTTDLGYINIHDGATNTLMLSENIDALDWIAAWGKNPVNPLQTAPNEHTPPQLSQLASYLAPPQAGFSWWQGMIWFVPSGAANNYGMPGSTSPLQTNHSPILNHDSTGNPDDLHNGRPHSNHPGGFVVTMCDGRAFFMGEDIGLSSLLPVDGAGQPERHTVANCITVELPAELVYQRPKQYPHSDHAR